MGAPSAHKCHWPTPPTQQVGLGVVGLAPSPHCGPVRIYFELCQIWHLMLWSSAMAGAWSLPALLRRRSCSAGRAGVLRLSGGDACSCALLSPLRAPTAALAGGALLPSATMLMRQGAVSGVCPQGSQEHGETGKIIVYPCCMSISKKGRNFPIVKLLNRPFRVR